MTELNILASEFLFSHSALGSEPGFPTNAFADCILALIERYPKLHKSARESLETFCEAVSETDNANIVISILLEGILRDDAILREACLHALGLFEIPASLSPSFALNVLIARKDELAEVCAEAKVLWESWNPEYVIPQECIPKLVSLTGMIKFD